MKAKQACTEKFRKVEKKEKGVNDMQERKTRAQLKHAMVERYTDKQAWHDNVINIALDMASARHIGKRRALYMAAHWLYRAADRMNDGRDVYTGVKCDNLSRCKRENGQTCSVASKSVGPSGSF